VPSTRGQTVNRLSDPLLWLPQLPVSVRTTGKVVFSPVFGGSRTSFLHPHGWVSHEMRKFIDFPCRLLAPRRCFRRGPDNFFWPPFTDSTSFARGSAPSLDFRLSLPPLLFSFPAPGNLSSFFSRSAAGGFKSKVRAEGGTPFEFYFHLDPGF